LFFGFAVENLNLKTLHHMMSTQVKGNGHFPPPIRVWNPDYNKVSSEHKEAGLSFGGVNALEIDGRLIGPLADPTFFEKLHASLEAELKKS
jgi:hypothetical protein